MNVDQRQPQPEPALMRQLVGEQIAQAQSPRPWASVASGPVTVRADSASSPTRSRVVLVAVAASVVALVLGLFALGSRTERDAPADTPRVAPIPSPVPLADVTEVADSQWVIPTDEVGEIEFQYAMRTGGESRSVQAGNDDEPERLIIHLGAPVAVSPATSDVVVMGRTWTVTADGSGWNASLADVEPTVLVHGDGAFDAGAEAVLGSLMVVATESLPSPPLDPGAPMTEVAAYWYEGERWVMEVQEANGYYCARIVAPDGGGVACGGSIDESGVFASFGGGGGYDYTDGASVVRANDWGIVHDDVVRIEVEFVDGSVAAVEPTNATDRFDGFRFWIVVGDVQLEGQSFDGLTPVRELRAYDTTGELLGTQRPGEG